MSVKISRRQFVTTGAAAAVLAACAKQPVTQAPSATAVPPTEAPVEATLVPRSSRRAGAYEITEERWIDHARCRVNKVTTVVRDGREVSRSEESVRLYSLEELMALLERGGLYADRVYGDFDEWCREVVWYGNKKGAYLYGTTGPGPELAGHY